MAFESEVEYTGEKSVDTLNARVRIEEGKNRFVITNAAGVEVLVINEVGMSITNGDGVKVLTITQNGMVMNDGSNDRLLIGRQDGGF